MKNILITGGAGYIGTVLSNILCKNKFNIFVVDNLSSGSKKFLNKKIKFYKIDISEKIKIKNILNENKIDIIIHLASKKSILESLQKPKLYQCEILDNSINLFKLAKKSNVKCFIFSSTAAVYGANQKGIFSENNKCMPISNYGKLKLKVEKYLKKQTKFNPHLKIIIFRFFNVVGADYSNSGQLNFDDNSLFSNLCLSIKYNNKLNIYGKNFKTIDGTCVRDYIHVQDLCNAIKKIIKKDEKLLKFNIFNIGYSMGSTVLAVIKSFEKISKKKIFYYFKSPREGEVPTSVASNSKIINVIKKFPRSFFKLDKMVRSHFQWFKKYHLL